MSVLIPKSSLKRKNRLYDALSSRKRQRKDVNSVDDLPWKRVSRPSAAGFEGDDGVLDLEEVDNVEVVYEETENGRTAKFKVLEVGDAQDDEKTSQVKESGGEDEDASEDDKSFDSSLLPDWSGFELHPRLLSALHRQNFSTPTPIQKQALPAALKGKDVIGVAETGSGKTLAYGLPILHYLLEHNRSNGPGALQALILAPTRELALQVASHLNACVSKSAEDRKRSTRVRTGTVVGGMAIQKQQRILERGVDVLVATPGRLWEIIEENDSLAEQIRRLRFLVLDEADRMIETGHFAELDNIVRLTTRQMRAAERDDAFLSEESSGDDEDVHVEEEKSLQTFIFSATLSRDLQQNLKRRKRLRSKTRKGDKNKSVSTLDELVSRLDFRDPEPEVIDLSPKGGVISTLQESQVECLSADKDVYLYYFLLRYPGRSLVFVSSIDGIRRLLPLCELLQLHAYPLHSQLQQRQRLKNLDRFKSTPDSILIATDVAARGLDIPCVDHVIHYQIPRSADVYIHRNGRTARASRSGFSLIMCAPDERRILRALLASLDRVRENEIPEMPIELDLLDKLKGRVSLAKRIDAATHKVRKEKHEKNWIKQTAEAMEIELDSDLDDKISDEDSPSKKRKDTKSQHQVQTLKSELKHLLSQPLVAKGVMKKYITSGARNVVTELLNSDGGDKMLGYNKRDARGDVISFKGLSKAEKKKVHKQKVEEQ